MAHKTLRGVRRFRLPPFLLLVAYRLRIFNHRARLLSRPSGMIREKAVQEARFSPSRGYLPGNDLLYSMLLRAERSGKGSQ